MSVGPLLRWKVLTPRMVSALQGRGANPLQRGVALGGQESIRTALRGGLGDGRGMLGDGREMSDDGRGRLQAFRFSGLPVDFGQAVGEKLSTVIVASGNHPLQDLLQRRLAQGLAGAMHGNPLLTRPSQDQVVVSVGLDGRVSVDGPALHQPSASEEAGRPGMFAAGGGGRRLNWGGVKRKLAQRLDTIKRSAGSPRVSRKGKVLYKALERDLGRGISMLDSFVQAKSKLQAGQDLLRIADLGISSGANLDLVHAILGEWLKQAEKPAEYDSYSITQLMTLFRQGLDFRIASGHMGDTIGRYEWNGKPVRDMEPLEIREIFADYTRGAKYQPFVALARRVLDEAVLPLSIAAERMTSSPTTSLLAGLHGMPHVAQVTGKADCTPEQLYNFFRLLQRARDAGIRESSLPEATVFMNQLRALFAVMKPAQVSLSQQAAGERSARTRATGGSTRPRQTSESGQGDDLDKLAQMTGQQIYDAFVALTRGERDIVFLRLAGDVLSKAILPSYMEARHASYGAVEEEAPEAYKRIGPNCTPEQLARFLGILEEARERRNAGLARGRPRRLIELSQEIKNIRQEARSVVTASTAAVEPASSQQPARPEPLRRTQAPDRVARAGRPRAPSLSPKARAQLLLDHMVVAGAIDELESIGRCYDMLTDAAYQIRGGIEKFGYQAYRLEDQLFFLQFMSDADLGMSSYLAKYLLDLKPLSKYSAEDRSLLGRVLRLRFLGTRPRELSRVLVAFGENDLGLVRAQLNHFEGDALRASRFEVSRRRPSDEDLVRPPVSSVKHDQAVAALQGILDQGVPRTRIYKYLADNYDGADTLSQQLNWIVEKDGRLAYELGLLLGREKDRSIISSVIQACYNLHMLQGDYALLYDTAYHGLMNILISRRYGVQSKLIKGHLDKLSSAMSRACYEDLSALLVEIKADVQKPIQGNVQELWLNAIREIQWMIMEARREDRPKLPKGEVPPVPVEEHGRLDGIWMRLEDLKGRALQYVDFGVLEAIAAEIIPDTDSQQIPPSPQFVAAPAALVDDSGSMPGMTGPLAVVLPDWVRSEVDQVPTEFELRRKFSSQLGGDVLRRLLNHYPILCQEVMLLTSFGRDYDDLVFEVLRVMSSGSYFGMRVDSSWKARYFQKLADVLFARRLMVSVDSLRRNLNSLIGLSANDSFTSIDIDADIELFMSRIERGDDAQKRVIVERYAKELKWMIAQSIALYTRSAQRRQHGNSQIGALQRYLGEINSILEYQDSTFRESINQLNRIWYEYHGITSRRRF